MEQKLKNMKVMVVRHAQTDHVTGGKQGPDAFHKISVKISNKLGSAWAFYLALLAIITWGVSGPLFGFSNTWQLVINTGTTIITFLMVFVIQNTQNRDSKAMQLKLDELINASKTARTEFVDVEDLNDAELDELQQQFREIHQRIEEKTKKD